MNYSRLMVVAVVLLAACSEPELEETLICWTESDETDLSAGKYSPLPETICVPIAHAPTLPASILDRAVIRNDRGDRSDGRSTGGITTEKSALLELSEINDFGPAAGMRKSDDTVEYSMINRDADIVRAVDDRTVTNADDAKKLRDEIFSDVGM